MAIRTGTKRETIEELAENTKKQLLKLGVVVYTCLETEAGRSQVQGQLGLHSKSLSQTKHI